MITNNIDKAYSKPKSIKLCKYCKCEEYCSNKKETIIFCEEFKRDFAVIMKDN